MQTLRFYQVVQNQKLILNLPAEFLGNEVEVIVLIHSQLATSSRKKRIQSFRGILQNQRSRNEIDLFILNLRSEWENNI